MIALTSSFTVLDLVSVNPYINHTTQIQQCVCNHVSQTTWFDIAGAHYRVYQSAPLNAFESIVTLLVASFVAEPVKAYFWSQSTVPTAQNNYWMNTAKWRNGLDMHDPVFEPDSTSNLEEHSAFHCDPEIPRNCEEFNWVWTDLRKVTQQQQQQHLNSWVFLRSWLDSWPLHSPELMLIIDTSRCSWSGRISWSEQRDWVALVYRDDQAYIQELLDVQRDGI